MADWNNLESLAAGRALAATFVPTFHGHSRRSASPPRSASPYSMVEVDITDPTYTPPSLGDLDGAMSNEKTFIDDSIDTASFCGSLHASPAISRKIHGSYVRSYVPPLKSLVGENLFDEQNKDVDAGVRSTTDDFSLRLGLPDFSHPADRNWMTRHSSQYSGSKSAAEKMRRHTSQNDDDGWGIGSASSPMPRTQHKSYGPHSGPFDCGLWRASSSSSRHEKHGETAHDPAILLERVSNLEDRINAQEIDMDRHLRRAPAAKDQDQYNTDRLDQIAGVVSSDLDFLRACVSGFEISPAERSKALSILNAFRAEKTPRVTQKYPTTSAIQDANGVDSGTARVESQLRDMSRNIIKLKAYEKFRRMQEDSDRIARIESKLAGYGAKDFSYHAPVAVGEVQGLNDLRARLTRIEEIGEYGKPNAASASDIEYLTEEVQALRHRVSDIQDVQRADARSIRDELLSLENRFDQMRSSAAGSASQDEEFSTTSSCKGPCCKSQAGWHASTIRSSRRYMSSQNHLTTSKKYLYSGSSRDTWPDQKSNGPSVERGGWGMPSAGFEYGTHQLASRRSHDWGDKSDSDYVGW